MSFECAACHEYVAGVGCDPPQFCNDCEPVPKCMTCGVTFEWGERPTCGHVAHGEFPDCGAD